MTTLFSAFDLFPSSKGASTHIAHTVKAMEKKFGKTILISLGYGDMPGYQKEGDIIIRRFLDTHPNLLERADYFGDFVYRIMTNSDDLQIIHFRDIWSGIPILAHPESKNSLIVYEVNGLPSIELVCHYPRLMKNPGLINRIKDMEDFCLKSAHGIITVSQVNKRCLMARGVDPEKIVVIPNTVYPQKCEILSDDNDKKEDFILYAGTLAPWQGLPTLLKAFSMIADKGNLCLYLACSTRKHLRPVRKMIRKLGLEQNMELDIGLSRKEVYKLYRKSLFSVAPLTRCARNEIQGCSPLKIIESMSAGTPVIASGLPVCSEIIEHEKDGLLVTPDSARSLALAMERLVNDKNLVKQLGKKAAKKIKRSYSHETWATRLYEAYDIFFNRL